MGMPDPRRYVVVYTELRRRIEAGTYPRGSRLPTLGELSDEFDVARDTAQHALQLLEEQGLAVRYPGLGYFVAD